MEETNRFWAKIVGKRYIMEHHMKGQSEGLQELSPGLCKGDAASTRSRSWGAIGSEFSIHWDIFVKFYSFLHPGNPLYCNPSNYSHRLQSIHQYLKKNQRRLCIPTFFFSALEENYNHHFQKKNIPHAVPVWVHTQLVFVTSSTGLAVWGVSRTRPDGDGGCGSHWEITLEAWGSGTLPCESLGEMEKGGAQGGRVATKVIYSDSCHSIRLV